MDLNRARIAPIHTQASGFRPAHRKRIQQNELPKNISCPLRRRLTKHDSPCPKIGPLRNHPWFVR